MARSVGLHCVRSEFFSKEGAPLLGVRMILLVNFVALVRTEAQFTPNHHKEALSAVRVHYSASEFR
jgi:hypothetical protein